MGMFLNAILNAIPKEQKSGFEETAAHMVEGAVAVVAATAGAKAVSPELAAMAKDIAQGASLPKLSHAESSVAMDTPGQGQANGAGMAVHA